MLTFGDIFSPLAINILNRGINIFHEQHLTNLKMVTLRSKMKTTASN